MRSPARCGGEVLSLKIEAFQRRNFWSLFRRFQIRADNRELLWKGRGFNSLVEDNFLFMRNSDLSNKNLQIELLITLEWIQTLPMKYPDNKSRVQ